MRQWIAGHSSRTTSTPMICVACSADRSCLMRVLCLVLLQYCCCFFRLGATRVASHDLLKTNPDAIFSRISSENGPPFSVGGRPEKTISGNGRLKNHQFRVYKIGKPVLRPEDVHFRIQKRCCKRWLQLSNSFFCTT